MVQIILQSLWPLQEAVDSFDQVFVVVKLKGKNVSGTRDQSEEQFPLIGLPI